MNFKLLSAFAAISLFGFAAAEENLAVEENYNPARSSARLSSTEKCTRELEGVVYQPETAARLYLNKISEQIKIASPILWTEQANGYIQNFEQKYNVVVTILDAFRNVVNVPVKCMVQKTYYSTTSTANLNGSGFAVDTDKDERIVYEFIVFNQFGELKYVMITMPLSNSPSEFNNVWK